MVDAFVGVQPESAIRSWIDRLLPTEAESLVAEARGLESSDPGAAEEKYGQALALQNDLTEAEIGLARIALAEGRVEDATAGVAALERRGFLEPEAEKLKAELTLRTQAQGAGSVEAARSALAAHPGDLTLKLNLAEALAAAAQYPDALALCLELVERDRKGVGEQARQTMVAIFQLFPPGDELVHRSISDSSRWCSERDEPEQRERIQSHLEPDSAGSSCELTCRTPRLDVLHTIDRFRVNGCSSS